MSRKSQAVKPANVNAKTFAQIVGVSYPTVLKLIYSGELKSARIGNQHIIPLSAITAMGLDVPADLTTPTTGTSASAKGVK
ncbi:MAG: helix-turn-helix domain-containing protein [Actinomyces ruminicola]|nr:helix-turn-helix domain-containing protein [Actinomyces ruminicola]